MDKVTAFHRKHGFPVGRKEALHEEYDQSTILLGSISNTLIKMSTNILSDALVAERGDDSRLYRVHLMLEEMGELIQGMSNGDDVEVLDGGLDLLFVLLGTIGTTYELPLDEGWEEICRSNMSKRIRAGDDLRMRDKGPDYSPPDLKTIMEQHLCEHDEQEVNRDGCRITLVCRVCGKIGVEYA